MVALIHEFNFHAEVATAGRGYGLVERDYDQHPIGSYGSARPMQDIPDMPVIPLSQWREILRERKASKQLLSDIRNTANNGQPIPSLNQGNFGYCWAHSPTSAAMLLRAIAGLPYVPLSAFSVAATIKNGRDEGGWAALAADFIATRGVASQHFWPQGSANLKYGTKECWDDAAHHKFVESWVDLQASIYDRNLSRLQFGTCLLNALPCPSDYPWWSHSVCAMDLVDGLELRNETRMESGKLATLQEFDQIWDMGDEFGGFGVRIWNSWSDSYKENGTVVLAGSRAWPGGGLCCRLITPSVN